MKIAWDFYLQKFNSVISSLQPKHVLKTDCNNEAFDRPKRGGLVMNLTDKSVDVSLVEYDKDTISKALDKFPSLKVVQGDIRNLPFDTATFDLVADFSTLDHVPGSDVERTLTEYFRVLRNEGLLLLVCWFSYDRSNVISNLKSWNPNAQYFLWEQDILDFFSKNGLKVVEKETITRIAANYKWLDVPRKDAKYYLEFMLVQRGTDTHKVE